MKSAILLSLVSVALFSLLGRSRSALHDSPESIIESAAEEGPALFIG